MYVFYSCKHMYYVCTSICMLHVAHEVVAFYVFFELSEIVFLIAVWLFRVVRNCLSDSGLAGWLASRVRCRQLGWELTRLYGC